MSKPLGNYEPYTYIGISLHEEFSPIASIPKCASTQSEFTSEI